jgi:hypothetical protein
MVIKPSNSNGDDGFGDFDRALITIVGDFPLNFNEIVLI